MNESNTKSLIRKFRSRDYSLYDEARSLILQDLHSKAPDDEELYIY